MNKKFNTKLWWEQIDKVNFILILMLALIGIILSFSLNDSYLFLNKHLIFSMIGIFIMIFVLSIVLEKMLNQYFFSNEILIISFVSYIALGLIKFFIRM